MGRSGNVGNIHHVPSLWSDMLLGIGTRCRRAFLRKEYKESGGDIPQALWLFLARNLVIKLLCGKILPAVICPAYAYVRRSILTPLYQFINGS